MNIAQVSCTYPPYKGGMGNSVLNFSTYLSQLENNITVFTPNYQEHKTTSEQANDWLKVVRLNSWLKSGNAASVPQLFFRLKSFEIVHFHYPFYGASLAVLLNKYFRPKSKLVVHFHMDNFGSGLKGLIFKLNRIFILPLVLRAADQIISASIDYVTNSSIKNLYNKYSAKFVEIPFGVDSTKFRPRETELRPEKTLLFVGGLDQAHYFKGLELLINAIKTLTTDQEIDQAGLKIKLNIVGNGELKKYYTELASNLKIKDQINIIERVDDLTLVNYYQTCDLFVLPSINQGEAFGLVLLEAMSTGKPVVASDLPGVRQVFRDGRDGLLFKTKNLPDLTQKLKTLLLDANLATTLGKSGRQLVLEKYDWQIVTQKLNQAYLELLTK